MPRKRIKQPTYTVPSLPILKLADVPGPEADVGVLNAHYRLVQEAFATHRYDDVIQSCHWCLDMEAGLAYSKTDEARGTRMFCSGRCASAYSAYQVKVQHIDRKPPTDQPPDDGDDPADDSDETPEPTSETAPTVAPPDDEGGGTPIAEITKIVGEEGRGRTAWKPTGERGRKARKPRADKPKRTDGLCTKGKHEMTEANTYSYNGGTWCRECRKASRAKSKNGG